MDKELAVKFLVLIVAAICAVGKYLNVAALKGEAGGQLLRLMPIVGYVAVPLAVFYIPGLVLWSVVLLLLLRAADYALSFGDIYNAARKAIPPTTADLFRRLRFAPWVLIGLALAYTFIAYHGSQHVQKQTPSAPVSPVHSEPSPDEQSDRKKWEYYKQLN